MSLTCYVSDESATEYGADSNLVEVLEEIEYAAGDLLLIQAGARGIAADSLDGKDGSIDPRAL